LRGITLKRENIHHKKIEDHNHEHEHEHEDDNNLHETQRLKALISHWIEHNTGHLEKIREHAKIAEEEGASEVAKHLNEAVNYMQKAIDSLELALKNL
jgi:flagellar hook-basal body complex protein FliE